MSMLSKPYFHNETAAFDRLEKILWSAGVVCPKCGVVDRAGKLKGKATRPGVWKCYACRKQFTCTVGTVFESRHIPLHKMLQAVYLLTASKKGCSAHQLHRTLEITYKSAWFLAHRIREAMRTGALGPLGGEGMFVEADETFMGAMRGQPRRRPGTGSKIKILTLIERGGSARSFHIEKLTNQTVHTIVRDNIAKESHFRTDEANHYRRLGKEFATHEAVEHNAEEYVRGDAHVNTAEGFFSIFKRGMRGVYQHCSEKHLHRYLAEFDFRYSNRVARGVNDNGRNDRALMGIVGKRLKYRAADRIEDPAMEIPF